jgi:HEPN domain-containing protein
MTTRYRELDSRVRIDGGITRVFWTGGEYTYEIFGSRGERVKCGDTVGEFDTDNGLSIDRSKSQFACLEGTHVEGPIARRIAKHCPVQGIAMYTIEDPRGQFGLPNFSEEATGWIGRMQPGKAHINLPATLGEARDIPQLITQFPDLVMRWGAARFGRNAGKAAKAAKVAQEAANALGSSFLWAKFGLSPTTRDLLAMLGLLEEFFKNLEGLLQLARGGSIKRSIRLSSPRIVCEDGNIHTHSAGLYTYHNRVRIIRMQDWVTSRWVPIFPWDYKFDKPSQLINKAMRQTLGLNPSGLLAAWWELLPWSWLVDWIARVQQQLQLIGGNSLGLRCESVCYCRTCTVDVYWHCTQIPEGIREVGRNFHQRVTKERFPLAGADISYDYTPSQPALSSGQAGILGALAAQFAGNINPRF